MAKVAKRRGYSYRVTDLDYPAVSVSQPLNALGAKIGGGKAFAFGRSVEAGVNSLKNYYKTVAKKCSDTRWVLAGYSQGALVVAQAVEVFNAAKVVYVGMFGDPWTNLPEGKGLLPKACYGKNLSSYRVYVPDCGTHTGSLGAKNPYVRSGLWGKYGLWCNKNDYVCGSSWRLSDNAGHTKYAQKKEFIWMANIVEKRLPKKTDVVIKSAGPEQDEDGEEYDEIDDIFEAHFTAEPYVVDASGGTVTIDASPSFSLGHDIVEYQWSINGGEFWSTGNEPTITRSVSYPDVEEVTVRVINDMSEKVEATTQVVPAEGDGVDNAMVGPRHLIATCAEGEAKVDWMNDWPDRARYILFRLNDVDLDYVPVAELGVVITDIGNGEIESLKATWLDGDLGLGDWAEVSMDCPASINTEPVETGVLMTSPMLLALGAMAACAVMTYKKYLLR